MTSSLEFRDVPESELDRALDHAYLSFHLKSEPERRARNRAELAACDRVGAYQGDQLVGLLGALPLELSVPGGELPCAGVTFVTVAPTHRRRGILSGLIGHLWERCAANGQPIAALWASESAIYGRFGFGAATRGATIEIDSTRPLALRIDADAAPLSLVDTGELPKAVAAIEAVHAAARARRPGRVTRDTRWWRDVVLPEKTYEDEELGPARIVTNPGGYAVYRTRGGDEEPGGRRGRVEVVELEADSPAGAAALWEYLASIDLTGSVHAWGRPLDDPLLEFAADRDQVRVTSEFPALWLRLADVGTALMGRTWSQRLSLVLELTDSRVPANQGRFLLEAGPGATTSYQPTGGPPDLSLDVRELGSCYLGDARTARLVRAGLVTEHTRGAAGRFDAALAGELLPHTVDGF